VKRMARVARAGVTGSRVVFDLSFGEFDDRQSTTGVKN